MFSINHIISAISVACFLVKFVHSLLSVQLPLDYLDMSGQDCDWLKVKLNSRYQRFVWQYFDTVKYLAYF